VSRSSVRSALEALLSAALQAVDGEALVRAAVAIDGDGLRLAGRRVPPGARLQVVAVGKAAAAMAAGLEAVAGARVAGGLVVTKDRHLRPAAGPGGLPPPRWTQREAGHPVPDGRSEAAAREVLARAAATGPGDVLVVLLSGGASALLGCPAPGLRREDLEATTRALLDAGADIEELNTVRKHLSEVAGGRLARAAGAGCIELLAISDVVGDRLDVIGSGPCSPDPTRYADALDVLARRAVRDRVPAAVLDHLAAGARGERAESPKPGAPGFERVHATLLASNATALAAAATTARRRGLAPIVVSRGLRGEARTVGARLAALGLGLCPARPTCLVAGGETTVTVRGAGRGGRCQELALAAARVLAGTGRVSLLAAGTDGSDGPTDAAGAFADGETVPRGASRGVDAGAALAANDAYGFFCAEGGLLHTGPTGTNVMDLVLVHVAGPGDA
jgi:glycerate 2-kinase